MRPWISLRLIGLGVLGLALTGCNSSSATCKNGSCEVTVSGRPEVNLGAKQTTGPYRHRHVGTDRRRFKIVRYQGNAVTINCGAQTDTVRVGETKTINGLIFQVRSIDSDANGAKLHVGLG